MGVAERYDGHNNDCGDQYGNSDTKSYGNATNTDERMILLLLIITTVIVTKAVH